MHVLVCLSAIGAIAVRQYGEAAAVAFLFGFAHLLEAWSIERARAAVAELVGHEPGWGAEGRHQSADVERWIERLSLIHISEPTRLLSISYAVFCLKKK